MWSRRWIRGGRAGADPRASGLPLLAALALGCGEFGLEEYSDAGASVEVEPEYQVRFDATSAWGQPSSAEIIIRSTGDQAAVIEDIRIEGADAERFSLDGVSVPKGLAPGNALPVTLRFSPDGEGQYVAIVAVRTQIEGHLSVNRNLIGEGCADADQDGRCDSAGPPPPSDSGDAEGMDTGPWGP